MKLKTREALRNIKTFDRAEDWEKKTRQGVSDLNQSVDQVLESGYESETDYAGNQVQNAEGQITRYGFYTADRTGTKALIAALAAGGWLAVVVVVMICVVALIDGHTIQYNIIRSFR